MRKVVIQDIKSKHTYMKVNQSNKYVIKSVLPLLLLLIFIKLMLSLMVNSPILS